MAWVVPLSSVSSHCSLLRSSAGRYRLVRDDYERPDVVVVAGTVEMIVVVMAVRVVMVMAVMMRLRIGIGLRREPAFDVRDPALWIVEAGVEQLRRRRLAFGGVEHRRGGIERLQPRQDAAALRISREIGLAQHDAVGDRGLLHGFFVRVQRRLAVDRIDHGDDAVQPVTQQQIGMRHHRVQHRRRIGEAGGLEQHALEADAAIVEIAQQPLERVDEIAAHGAA